MIRDRSRKPEIGLGTDRWAGHCGTGVLKLVVYGTENTRISP